MFAIAKFALGAWIVLVIVPVLVAIMLFIKREYAQEYGLAVRPDVVIRRPHRRQRVVVAAPTLTRARRPGREGGEDHVAATSNGPRHRRSRSRASASASAWSTDAGVGVVVVESPYRSLVRPFVRYLEAAREEDPDAVLMVLLPENLPRHWWERMLYNQNVYRIREALVGRPEIVVLDVPYRRESIPAAS